MRYLTQFLGVALIGMFAATFNCGCASTGSSGGGLTLQQTHQQVENAVLIFQEASVAGAITTAQREHIQAAYKQYQAAYSAALMQAGSNEKAAAPDNVKAAAENVVARVSALP